MKITEHIGLDIGTNEVKAVYLTPEGDKFKLVAFGSVATPAGGSASENLADQQKLADNIRQLLRDAGINSRRAVIALPESQVFTRVIETPFLTDTELDSAINWEAEQYVPVPLSDVLLRHQILTTPEKNDPNGKMTVLIVAAPNTVINRYMKIIELAGLELGGIETEILAISRALMFNDPASPPTLIINLGAATTDISVVNKGILSFARSLPTGGDAVTRAMSTDLNLDPVQAEEYKRAYGLDKSKLDGKVFNSIKTVIDIITAEVKKGLVYYQTKQPDDVVRRVVLSGGMAQMPGLVDFLAQGLTMEVQVGNSLAGLSKTEQQARALLESAPLYTVAVGLALKQI